MQRQRAHADRPRRLAVADGQGGNFTAQAFGNLLGAEQRRVRAHYQEFIAAVAAGDVAAPQRSSQNFTNRTQQVVAAQVTQFVVDPFEMIDVDCEQRERAEGKAADAPAPGLGGGGRHFLGVARGEARVEERR